MYRKQSCTGNTLLAPLLMIGAPRSTYDLNAANAFNFTKSVGTTTWRWIKCFPYVRIVLYRKHPCTRYASEDDLCTRSHIRSNMRLNMISAPGATSDPIYVWRWSVHQEPHQVQYTSEHDQCTRSHIRSNIRLNMISAPGATLDPIYVWTWSVHQEPHYIQYTSEHDRCTSRHIRSSIRLNIISAPGATLDPIYVWTWLVHQEPR